MITVVHKWPIYSFIIRIGTLGVEMQTYPAYSHVDYTIELPYGEYVTLKEMIIKGMILATNT